MRTIIMILILICFSIILINIRNSESHSLIIEKGCGYYSPAGNFKFKEQK